VNYERYSFSSYLFLDNYIKVEGLETPRWKFKDEKDFQTYEKEHQ